MTETVGSQAESQSEPGTMEARCFFVKGRSLPSWKPNPGNKCSPDSKCTRYFLPLTETHMSVCSNRWLKALFSPCSHWNRAFFISLLPTDGTGKAPGGPDIRHTKTRRARQGTVCGECRGKPRQRESPARKKELEEMCHVRESINRPELCGQGKKG